MNLAISIILIIISIGSFFTFIDPTYQDIKELKEVKSSYLEKENSALLIQKTKDDLTQIYTEINQNDNLKKIEKFLPDNIDNIELIVDINRIARERNIRNISDISLERGGGSSKIIDANKIVIKKDTDYESVILSFSFVSNYENFKKFLGDLRQSLRLSDISNISIRKEFGRDNSGNIENDIFSYSLSIRTYWLKK